MKLATIEDSEDFGTVILQINRTELTELIRVKRGLPKGLAAVNVVDQELVEDQIQARGIPHQTLYTRRRGDLITLLCPVSQLGELYQVVCELVGREADQLNRSGDVWHIHKGADDDYQAAYFKRMGDLNMVGQRAEAHAAEVNRLKAILKGIGFQI